MSIENRWESYRQTGASLEVESNALVDVNQSTLTSCPTVAGKIKGIDIDSLLVELWDEFAVEVEISL